MEQAQHVAFRPFRLDMTHACLWLGPGLYRSYFLGLLAEAYGQATQPEAGLRVLAEALTLVATTGVRWWEAELYCLQGALRLQLPSPEVDRAIRLHRPLEEFLAQSKEEATSLGQGYQRLEQILGGAETEN